MKYVTTTIEEETFNKVEQLARKEKRRRSAMLRILVEEALEARKQKEQS